MKIMNGYRQRTRTQLPLFQLDRHFQANQIAFTINKGAVTSVQRVDKTCCLFLRRLVRPTKTIAQEGHAFTTRVKGAPSTGRGSVTTGRHSMRHPVAESGIGPVTSMD